MWSRPAIDAEGIVALESRDDPEVAATPSVSESGAPPRRSARNSSTVRLVGGVQQALLDLRIVLRGANDVGIFLHRQPMRLDRLHRLGIGLFAQASASARARPSPSALIFLLQLRHVVQRRAGFADRPVRDGLARRLVRRCAVRGGEGQRRRRLKRRGGRAG